MTSGGRGRPPLVVSGQDEDPAAVARRRSADRGERRGCGLVRIEDRERRDLLVRRQHAARPGRIRVRDDHAPHALVGPVGDQRDRAVALHVDGRAAAQRALVAVDERVQVGLDAVAAGDVGLQQVEAVDLSPDRNPGCKDREQFRAEFRTAVLRAMDALKLDALVYPTWSNPPRLIGDLNSPPGDNSQLFSPSTGWPAITVPMGYTRGILPAGMTFFGRAWSEPVLIRLAYSYEQATHHRRPPASTPPLR